MYIYMYMYKCVYLCTMCLYTVFVCTHVRTYEEYMYVMYVYMCVCIMLVFYVCVNMYKMYACLYNSCIRTFIYVRMSA